MSLICLTLLIYTGLMVCGRLVDSNRSVHCVKIFLYMFFPKYSIFNFRGKLLVVLHNPFSWVSCNSLGTSFQCLNTPDTIKNVSDHVTHHQTYHIRLFFTYSNSSRGLFETFRHISLFYKQDMIFLVK